MKNVSLRIKKIAYVFSWKFVYLKNCKEENRNIKKRIEKKHVADKNFSALQVDRQK